MDKHKIEAALLGVMIGDALGAPVETMSHSEILTHVGRVEGFIKPVQWRFKDTQNLLPGQTTDDWQLTKAVAKGILNAGEYNQLEMARAHVEALKTRTVGWGGTTDLGIKEIKLWFDSNGKQGRNPEQPVGDLGEGMGGGNGIAMKCVPLVALHALNGTEACLIKDLRKLAALTHQQPEPLWMAVAFSLIVWHGFRHSQLLPFEQLLAKLQAFQEPSTQKTLRQLQKTKNNLSVEKLIANITPGFSALQSVAFAIGMCYALAPEKVLLECVNAGGDSDSTAAMCGAMLGAVYGVEIFPKQWREFRSEYGEAKILAEKLYNLA